MDELWKKLSPVAQGATKKFKRAGGFSGTDINPQWRMKRMTEVFGPVGVGWGYEIEDRWSETITQGDGEVTIAYVQVKAWWIHSQSESKEEIDRNYTGSQIGGTSMKRTPDESYKMAITDALGKCLAQIGLAAEVYLGEFDQPVDYATAQELQVVRDLIEKHQMTDLRRFLKAYSVSTVDELTSKQATNAAEMIRAKYEVKS